MVAGPIARAANPLKVSESMWTSCAMENALSETAQTANTAEKRFNMNGPQNENEFESGRDIFDVVGI